MVQRSTEPPRPSSSSSTDEPCLTGDEIVDLLGDKGFRRTRSRRVLADLIAAKQGRHFASSELERELQLAAPDIGRATLFRMLATLERQGVLGQVHLESGEHGYIVCGDPRAHHHHAVCTKCGVVVPVGACGVDARLEAVELETSFQMTGHRLEYFGVCPSCQAR